MGSFEHGFGISLAFRGLIYNPPAREPWAAFRAFSQYDRHLLIAIFFVLFAEALAIDLLTYWPSVIASW
jgi:hypothetical protein